MSGQATQWLSKCIKNWGMKFIEPSINITVVLMILPEKTLMTCVNPFQEIPISKHPNRQARESSRKTWNGTELLKNSFVKFLIPNIFFKE